MGEDVHKAVFSILNDGVSPELINHTHVVFIMKKKNPTSISNFKPISLCNMVYKQATKVIASRLKAFLLGNISANQCAFILGRLITDNILVSYEVFNSMYYHKGINGSMVITLDMTKAYGRVEWVFQRIIMLRLKFDPKWVDLVTKCIKTATFSFIINGQPRGFLRPSCGILSVSLFIFIVC